MKSTRHTIGLIFSPLLFVLLQTSMVYAKARPRTFVLQPHEIVHLLDGTLGKVLCAKPAGYTALIAVGQVSQKRYELLYEKRLRDYKARLKVLPRASARKLNRRIRQLQRKREAANQLCRSSASQSSQTSSTLSGDDQSLSSMSGGDQSASSSSESSSFSYIGGGYLEPLDVDNTKSGISLSLSGMKGLDYAVEHTFHDITNGDQVIYLKSTVTLSLSHNENNTIMKRDSPGIPAVLGVGGLDGLPNSGDEGDIHYKIDRDMQSHLYNSKGSNQIPSFAPVYSSPISLETLTYDGVKAILGSTGDNDGPWGSEASNTTQRFGYGQLDPAGNECHTLTYWDDDEPLFRLVQEDSHRQGTSDGHWVLICVNPMTPIIQLIAPAGEQFYTTPLKTYHIPKLWQQTSYMTRGVELNFINLANAEAVHFRINGGAWRLMGERNLLAGEMFPHLGEQYSFEVRAGASGPILERRIVVEPDYPGLAEEHGRLLWASEEEFDGIYNRLKTIQPFKRSYEIFLGSYYQGAGALFGLARGGWCSGASQASTALNNAFAVAIDGPEARIQSAQLAKERLLRLARLEPVGNEQDVNSATPGKDYLNELGQTIQSYADAGVAYDLIAAHFRASQHPEGMTPIQELRIRDGLAEVAKTTLQFRDNYSYTHGGGDSHWPLGFELAIGTIALAMPSYRTPYFGVSGADGVTKNEQQDVDGKYWNPFPDQGITWYEAATDPDVACPGFPNNKAPPRSEFLYTEDGYWTGPNDLQGDGDRYVTGPAGSRLVDVKYGGLANAENRVELVEMAGYESPFVGRLYALEYMRRLKGDSKPRQAVQTYIQRRLMYGYLPLSWNAGSLRYERGAAKINTSLLAFNPHFPFAHALSARVLVEQFLSDLNRYYGYEQGSYPASMEDERKSLYNPYCLALCRDPSELSGSYGGENTVPIIKPMFKYVVKPGETVYKTIVALDLDGDEVELSVSGLPGGAVFDAGAGTITWTPQGGDEGVHMLWLSANDGTNTTIRPFPVIVKSNAGSGPIPAAPSGLNASVDGLRQAHLSWSAPQGVEVAYYLIYRDGAFRDVVPASQLSYVDLQLLPQGSHTRYSISALATSGAESSAIDAQPSVISIAVN